MHPLVAEGGIEPPTQAYETRELPLLYPAIWRRWRDSNPRKRFCRPLVKPLTHTAICVDIEIRTLTLRFWRPNDTSYAYQRLIINYIICSLTCYLNIRFNANFITQSLSPSNCHLYKFIRFPFWIRI